MDEWAEVAAELEASAKLRTWTVVGYYPDSDEICVNDVTTPPARGVVAAAQEAYRQAAESGGSDLQLLAIIPGLHYDDLELPRPMDAEEFLQNCPEPISEEMKKFLLEAIGWLYGCEPVAEVIARRLYKGTSCGCWAVFDDQGIEIGTIVEGSDAEYHERLSLEGIEPGEAGAYTLVARWRAAVQNCIDFANETQPDDS